MGGASGTWTLAFLRAVPGRTATIFDLPDAIEQARQRLARSEFADRVKLVAGDFYSDELPRGADFAWVSAIVHQHSREHNRELFAKVHAALRAGRADHDPRHRHGARPHRSRWTAPCSPSTCW